MENFEKNVVVTGASGGIGGAIVEKFLDRPEDVQVIGVSRRTPDQLLGKHKNRDRYKHVPLDFLKEGDVRKTVNYIRYLLKGAGMDAMIHVAGLLEFDDWDNKDKDKENREKMNLVNCYTPLELSRELSNLMKQTSSTIYTSTASHGPRESVTPGAGIRGYIASKKNGEQSFLRLFGNSFENFSILRLGKYLSEMTTNIDPDRPFPFEWESVLGEDPAAPGGLADFIVKKIMKGEPFGSPIVKPKIVEFLLSEMTAEQQIGLMPWLMRLNAKNVLLKEFLFSDEYARTIHNANLGRHAEKCSYGKNFPYEDLDYDKLYSPLISKGLAFGMNALRLNR